MGSVGVILMIICFSYTRTDFKQMVVSMKHLRSSNMRSQANL